MNEKELESNNSPSSEHESPYKASEHGAPYMAPRLERLGKLGELIRGTSGTEFDWGTLCSSAGQDPDNTLC